MRHQRRRRDAFQTFPNLDNSSTPHISTLTGVEYIKAAGKLVGANEVECTMVEGGAVQRIKAKKIVLAVGSEVTPFPGGAITIDEDKVRG